MTEVVYYVAASLDGFVATPDGGVDWLAPFESAAEDYGYGELYASVGALLMGRRTCEQVLAWGPWPYPEKPTWVFSRQDDLALPSGLTLTRAGPDEVVAELAALGIGRAWLVGGGALTSAFRALGLVHEYIVSIMPVILGGGVPLFGATGPVEALRLVNCRTYPGGVVQVRYRPGFGGANRLDAAAVPPEAPAGSGR